MKLIRILTSSIMLAVFSLSMSNAMAEDSTENKLKKVLSEVFADIDVSRVSKTPINGIYEVMIGTDVVYMTSDAKYVLKGDLIDLQQRRNLSEDKRKASRGDLLKSIPKTEYIEFAGKESKDTIYVFTDVDCGYCRKLHRDIPELNDNAITVRYLAYPRAGAGSAAHKVMEDIWCSEDPAKAMTLAKSGDSIPEKKCDNPVSEQHALGREVGVRGTPAIYLESGKALPGYMPPRDILRILGR